ncbi:unnamed protein product [Vitrella brassicaformis CCMP3155]|uniref:SMB domain-containing protein n=1 Tax=Vitrella brassicaformis (strain CCMP3155) TaxID=1169540 RepID=A0A0G4FY10_VITBC|nr:unnamed protein product [Vitrella brassicaformis CCMP3155]|mmetsp:Transcript_30094/g.87375  ORF Transcript_30094/g.87375 Transcript_30094/m.87375 type:complete len:261 (-) Transcript_30094:2210-2992(-)|eukprot:CEM20039.1 unnamed protein product [Vitrella brassicaformis CCMP3155]
MTRLLVVFAALVTMGLAAPYADPPVPAADPESPEFQLGDAPRTVELEEDLGGFTEQDDDADGDDVWEDWMNPEHPDSPYRDEADEDGMEEEQASSHGNTTAVSEQQRPIGSRCSRTRDCNSKNCVNGWCWPKKALAPYGHRCRYDNDCCSNDCDDQRCDRRNRKCNRKLYGCMKRKTPSTPFNLHKYVCMTDLKPGPSGPTRLHKSGNEACKKYGWRGCLWMEVSCHNNNTPETWRRSSNTCAHRGPFAANGCAYRAVCF